MNTLACPSEQNGGIAFSLGERLRTIGQGLESLHVEDFELRTEGDGYLALGIPSAAVKNGDADGHISQFGVNRVLLKAWHSLIGRDAPERKFATPGSNVLRILFTAEGMLRLEHQGKLKRNSDSAGGSQSQQSFAGASFGRRMHRRKGRATHCRRKIPG